jgi:hypothetical protein
MSVAKRGDRADHCCMRNRLRTTLIAASVAAAAFAVGAPSASAGVLVQSAPDCSPKTTTQAFSKVDGDSTQYWLAPGGNFEAGTTPWTLSRGASVVSGNESWKVSGPGSRSLQLKPLATATSPVMCVGIEHPAVRLFAKSNNALLSTLSVNAIVTTSVGLKVPVPVGVLLPSGQWKPSPKLFVLASLLPLLPGEHTPIQFQITSVGLGTWSVDDFYVDPKCR